MKIEFYPEECHNEELINFIKNATNGDEVYNYADEHNISNWELIDAFFTVCRNKNTSSFYVNEWERCLCEILEDYFYEDVSEFYREDRSKSELWND